MDPIALGNPMYFDIIPRKDARDLSTLKQKLDADKYDSVDAFEADLDLMIDNAIRFNGLRLRGWKDILSRSREIQGHAFLASYHIQYKEERRR